MTKSFFNANEVHPNRGKASRSNRVLSYDSASEIETPELLNSDMNDEDTEVLKALGEKD